MRVPVRVYVPVTASVPPATVTRPPLLIVMLAIVTLPVVMDG